MPEALHGQGQRRATLRWTPHMRLTLHLMSTDFGMSIYSEQATKVFGVIFHDHIRKCGLAACPSKALGVQYCERTYAARTHIWSKILHPLNTAEEAAVRRDVRQWIADAIIQLDNGIQSSNVAAQSDGCQSQAMITVSTPKQQSRQKTKPIPSPSPTPRQAPAKRGRGRPKKVAMVVIPTATNTTSVAPRTPIKSPRTPKTTTPYARRYGPTLNLTDRALARIPYEWIPPAAEKVHLNPLPAIFFRFWSEDQTHCFNSKHGFIAGKYIKSNVVPRRAPSIDQLDPTDIVNHVEGVEIATPFISVSSSFIWSFKNALKENKRGRKLMVSLVSSSKLDPASIFYTRTMIGSVRNFLPFTGRKWLYYGSSEFFIWHEVPRDAILSSFALDKFLAMANASQGIATLIQPRLLQNTADHKLRDVLQASGCHMDEVVAAACADLAQYMGLKATSNIEQIEALVAEFVAGWAIKVEHLIPADWADLASVFAHAFNIRSLRPLSMRETQSLKMAFLLGVCRGLKDAADKDLAVQNSPASLKKLQQRIVNAGLQKSAAILSNALETELEEARNQLMVQQRHHDRRYLPAPSQMLLQDEVQVDDGFDGADAGMDVYEFDENGMIL